MWNKSVVQVIEASADLRSFDQQETDFELLSFLKRTKGSDISVNARDRQI